MDLIALGAAASLLVTVMVFALAFMSGSAATAQVRGRLEGVLAGAPPIDQNALDALRASRTSPGLFQSIMSGAFLARLENDLRLAESHLRPIDFITIRVALAGIAFVGPFLFIDGALGLLVGVFAVIAGFQAPQIWLNQRRDSRNKKLEAQLPDTLTSIANALKAGFGLLQGMSMAAQELENPVAQELKQTVHETNVGSSMDEAFLALGERNQSYDLDLVVTAVLVQRTAGGNLAEILQTVTETMRERARIRAEIVTLTAQQTLTGIVIALLPVAVGGMFMVVSPSYITVLFTETLGQVMLTMAVILETIGILVIKRILAIEV